MRDVQIKCRNEECAVYMVLQGNNVALRDVKTTIKPIRVCITHGAKVKEGIKRYSFEGCTKKAHKEGVCQRHYSNVTYEQTARKRCTHQCEKWGEFY
jgi:hypothetical protein